MRIRLSVVAIATAPSAHAEPTQKAAEYPPSEAARPVIGPPMANPMSKNAVKVPSAEPRRESATLLTTTSDSDAKKASVIEPTRIHPALNRVASQIAPYGGDEASAVAGKLDEAVLTLLRNAAG